MCNKRFGFTIFRPQYILLFDPTYMIGVDNEFRLGDGDLSPVIACLYLTVHSPPKKVDLKILILVNLVKNTSHPHFRY